MTKEQRASAIESLIEMRNAYLDLVDLFTVEGCEPFSEALNSSKATEIYTDVFSGSFDEIPLEEWCNRMIRRLSTQTYTVYADRDDMTFIMQEITDANGIVTTECIGWYFGEPNEAATEHYAGTLSAERN